MHNGYLDRRLTLQDLLREAPPEVRQREGALAAAQVRLGGGVRSSVRRVASFQGPQARNLPC